MSETIQIRKPEDLERVVDILTNLPIDPVHEVVIRKATSKRTIAQNRLYRYMLTVISKSTGTTEPNLDYEYKKKYLVYIYERDDNEFAELVDSIRKVYKNGMKNQAMNFWDFVINESSTTKATIKQFAEYLDKIFNDAADNQIAIPLRGDDDLMAIGRKKQED